MVYLNGEEIASLTTETENTVELADNMPLGENLLKVYTFGDGTVQSAESSFEVRKVIYTQNNIEKFDGSLGTFEITEGMNYSEFGSDSEGNKIYLSLTHDFDSPDGSKAAGFYAQGNVVSPKGTIRFFNKSLSGLFKNGIWVIQYDIKLFSKAHFYLETKNGAAGTFPFIGGKEFLKYDGNIASTGEAYPLGEWMHITHILDIDGKVQTHEISWLDNGESKIVSYETADANVASLSYIRPTTEFKQTTGDGEHGVLMDNIEIGTQQRFDGFTSLSYLDAGGEWIDAEDNIIDDTAIASVRLKNNNPYFKNMDITGSIKAYANGSQIAVKSANVDENGEYLTIDFHSSLPDQADINVLAECEDKDSGDKLCFVKNFKTDFLEFGIKELTFERGEECLGFSRQLKAGDSIDIIASFKNVVEDKNVVFVTAAYKGDEIIHLSAQNVESKYNRRKTATDTVTLPPDGSDFKIECYLFDTFLTRIPMSKIWTLK